MGDFQHKHSLGQNFLKDKNVLAKIIDSCDVHEDDLVIEIGPGQGALTRFLKLYKCQLLCFEVDERVKKYLNPFLDEKTKVIYEDFMKVDLVESIKDIPYHKLYIISNLPYYITTAIIEKIISSGVEVESMVLMVQNEVADRLSSKVGSRDYGAITVKLNYFYDVSKLFFVSRKSFDPVPNVDSAVIQLNKKEHFHPIDDEKYFFQLVRDAFSMKRKNIRNNLKKYDLDIVSQVLESYGLDLTCRAENISVPCFIDLANELRKEQ